MPAPLGTIPLSQTKRKQEALEEIITIKSSSAVGRTLALRNSNLNTTITKPRQVTQTRKNQSDDDNGHPGANHEILDDANREDDASALPRRHDGAPEVPLSRLVHPAERRAAARRQHRAGNAERQRDERQERRAHAREPELHGQPAAPPLDARVIRQRVAEARARLRRVLRAASAQQ